MRSAHDELLLFLEECIKDIESVETEFNTITSNEWEFRTKASSFEDKCRVYERILPFVEPFIKIGDYKYTCTRFNHGEETKECLFRFIAE
jgi:hypothetical protein